jgi:hypothetical protein
MKNKRLSIGQISGCVNSAEESELWCRDTLGLDHLYSFEKMAFFDCQGVRLMLSQTDSDLNHESLLYFKTVNIKSELNA